MKTDNKKINCTVGGTGQDHVQWSALLLSMLRLRVYYHGVRQTLSYVQRKSNMLVIWTERQGLPLHSAVFPLISQQAQALGSARKTSGGQAYIPICRLSPEK